MKTDALTIAKGGIDLEVSTMSGETLTVTVTLLPISRYIDFLNCCESHQLLAELVCRQEPGWAEGLHPDALMDIYEKAMELNFTRALRFAQQRAGVQEKLLPMLEGAREAQRAKQLLESSAPIAPSS